LGFRACEFLYLSILQFNTWINHNPPRVELSNENGEPTFGFSAIVEGKWKIRTLSAHRNKHS